MPATSTHPAPRFDAKLHRAIGVVVLIVVVVAGAGYLLASRMGAISSGADGTKGRAAAASMRTLVTSLKGYKAEKGVYPKDLASLVEARFVERLNPDPWQNPWVYVAPGAGGREFTLISRGPDGAAGTSDDIDWWSVE